MTCHLCNTIHVEAACPVCAPFKRLLALSRQKRKNYAQAKADERTDEQEQKHRLPYKEDL